MAERRTRTDQDEKFGKNSAEAIIEYAANIFEPDQVFDLDALCKCVKKNTSCEDVFGEAVLEEWAKDNGWRKE